MFNRNSLGALALRCAAALLVVAVVLALWVGGAQPVAVGLVRAPWDKLLHLGVFAVLAVAIGVASGLRGPRQWALAVAGAVLVGVLDEWHQASLPGRHAGWDDLLADAAGAALGAFALRTWQRRGGRGSIH